MQLTIVSSEGPLNVDTAHHADTPARAIPCHRCGICCERWQPLLTLEDAQRLAAHLGLAVADFHETYTTYYPFDDEQRLLRQEASRCVFLSYEQGGRAACTVHHARPEVCRAWQAGLEKKECNAGLERLAATGLIALDELYPEPEDRHAFARAARL